MCGTSEPITQPGLWTMPTGHLCVRPDEWGYNVWTARGRSRARQRERAYRQVWRHLTVTMVISLINWLACVFLRSCWRNECCAFRQLPRTGEDKFGSRRGGDLRVWRRAGPPKPKLKTLSPNSPFLNIDSCLKAAIKADMSRLEIERRMDNRNEVRTSGISLGEF